MTAADRAHEGPHQRFPALLRDPLRVLMTAGLGASIALHTQMTLNDTHGFGMSLVMAIMAIACLSCLTGLLRPITSADPVRMTMGMALAMALGHVLMLPLIGGGVHAHHSTAHAAAAVEGGGHGAMLLAMILELAVAALAVGWLRRTGQDRASVTSTPPHARAISSARQYDPGLIPPEVLHRSPSRRAQEVAGA